MWYNGKAMHVSKKNVDKELRQKGWARFSNRIKTADSGEEIIKCLGGFLTSDEIIALEKRLLIPLLLEKGFSYRRIGETIDVSPVTISFVKNKLKRKPVVRKRRSLIVAARKPKKELPILPPRIGYRRWFYERSKR